MSLRVAKIVTISVMVVSVAAWICWDIVVASLGLYPATESQILLVFGYLNISAPSAIGFVLGHLFWPARGKVSYRTLRIVVAATYGVLLIVANVLGYLPEVVPILPLVVHIPLGHLLWPQPERLITREEPR